MKTLGGILSAVVLLLASSVDAASMKSMFTAPALTPAGGAFFCDLVNVGKSTITVIINVHDTGGGVTGTSGSLTVTPGSPTGFPSGTATDEYCEFQVTGSTKTVRASAIYFDSGGYLMAIPAQ